MSKSKRSASENSVSNKQLLIKDNIAFFVMSAPAIIAVFIFSYLPMLGIVLAFKNFKYNKGIFGSDWVGFENFRFFFESNDSFRITFNTLYLNALFIATGIAVAVIVALMLYEVKARIRVKMYQTTMIFPHFLSMVVVAYIVYAFLNPAYGFLNKALVFFGFSEVAWYSKAGAWPFILLLVNIWKHFGMDCIVYYAALMSVDSELFEAAEIDGASKIKQIIHVSLPSLTPIITILAILAVGRIFRADFGLFYQVTMDVGQLYPTTDVIDTYVFRALKQLNNIGMSSAVGLFQSAVGFVTVLITNAIVRRIDADNALF